jgi:tetratricopeptide (TPR) repeat protein
VSEAAEDDRAAAAQLFRAGQAAYDRRDFDGAARSFEQAFAKAPRAAAMYAAALAWESAGEKARAANAFRRALEVGDLSKPNERNARAKLAKLSANLGELSVEAPSGTRISVAHLRAVAAPLRAFVEPGEHQVQIALSDGARQARQVNIGRGEVATITIEAPEPPPAAEERAPVRPPPAPKQEDSADGTRTLAWVAFGGSAAALGAAAFLGSRALSARNAWEQDPRTSNIESRERAASMRKWTNVMLGTGAVLGVAGLALWVAGPGGEKGPDKPDASARLVLGPAGGSIAIDF